MFSSILRLLAATAVALACGLRFAHGLRDAPRGHDRLPGLPAVPPARERSLGLIVRKKWNWKDASEETKTEWGIVLKRYVMVDLMLFELGRHFEAALPAPAQTEDGGGTAGSDGRLVVDEEALNATAAKLSKIKNNLDKAVLDQNTSDATSADMQKSRKSDHLSLAEKKTLWKEHLRERDGFFAVEASAQDVLQQAVALQQALETAHNAAHSPSWSSIFAAGEAFVQEEQRADERGHLHGWQPSVRVPSHLALVLAQAANVTAQRVTAVEDVVHVATQKLAMTKSRVAAAESELTEAKRRMKQAEQELQRVHKGAEQVRNNSTHVVSPNAHPAAPLGHHGSEKKTVTISDLFQAYQGSAQTFHTDIGNFEAMQRKAFTNLLSVHTVGN